MRLRRKSVSGSLRQFVRQRGDSRQKNKNAAWIFRNKATSGVTGRRVGVAGQLLELLALIKPRGAFSATRRLWSVIQASAISSVAKLVTNAG